MSDALNFPLSDSNDGSSIPGNMLGASCPREQDPAAADSGANATPRAAARSEQPAANSISTAAAQAARALGSEAGTKARDGNSAPSTDRRRRRRALISAPVRVRSVHVTENGPDEISTTIDVSRGGILFVTQNKCFERGMDVAVTFPYCKAPGALHAEQHGRVARIHEMADGRLAVAIAIGPGVGEDLVDSCGRKLDEHAVRVCRTPEPGSTRPLVLAVDADKTARESLRNYLTSEGYDVIAVKNAPDAREVLNHFTPALLIAEVEGEGLPGFELCVFVKSTEKLKKIPVLLTTRNGNPTDYSNAHSLGAVVCMAKPYRQERLGHVVRLLAPPPQALAQNAAAPRPPDPSRRTFNGNGAKPASSNSGFRWFRFPSIS
jgi:chemotaxis family two-component system response regulator PixH